MGTDFVLCEVGTEVWSLTYQHNMDKLRSGHSMVQRVTRRLITPEERIRYRISPCDFRWTKWHRDRFSSECFSFPLSISFQPCSVLTFMYTVLVPEQMVEYWETSKKKKAMIFLKSEELNIPIPSLFKRVLRFWVGSAFFIGKLLNCNFAAHDWMYLCARLCDTV
jgi:hypothetical protein